MSDISSVNVGHVILEITVLVSLGIMPVKNDNLAIVRNGQYIGLALWIGVSQKR